MGSTLPTLRRLAHPPKKKKERKEKKNKAMISPTACGALFSARATPQPSRTLWNPRGNMVKPWWNPRGTSAPDHPGAYLGCDPKAFSRGRKQQAQSQPHFKPRRDLVWRLHGEADARVLWVARSACFAACTSEGIVQSQRANRHVGGPCGKHLKQLWEPWPWKRLGNTETQGTGEMRGIFMESLT